jgi:hypothetical protein
MAPQRMTHERQFTSFRHRQMTHCGIGGLLERLPGVACIHWKVPPSHDAHPKRAWPTFSALGEPMCLAYLLRDFFRARRSSMFKPSTSAENAIAA